MNDDHAALRDRVKAARLHAAVAEQVARDAAYEAYWVAYDLLRRLGSDICRQQKALDPSWEYSAIELIVPVAMGRLAGRIEARRLIPAQGRSRARSEIRSARLICCDHKGRAVDYDGAPESLRLKVGRWGRTEAHALTRAQYEAILKQAPGSASQG